ncbi:MAG: hypothetical protein DI535_04875 [Citrobacter freundii]|nr:MAG: hypothetical protein DI535_04875 [Citrobacter freundii]
MKKTALAVVTSMVIAGTLKAQVQLSAYGSYLKGTSDNKAGLWGGGLNGKIFLGNSVALGVGLTSYPKKKSEIRGGSGAGAWTYYSADVVSNLAAGLDILLKPRTDMVQPYLGVDAGLSYNRQNVSYVSTNTQIVENKNNKTYFLLSPKAGLNIGLGQSFGIFGQVRYNFTFGEGDPQNITVGNIPNPITTEPVSKYFSFDAGLYIRLTGAGG